MRDIIHTRSSAIKVYRSKSPTYQSDFARSTFQTTAHTSKSKYQHNSSIHHDDYTPGPFPNSHQATAYKPHIQSVKLPKDHSQKMALLSSIRKRDMRASEPQKELEVEHLQEHEQVGESKSTSRFDPKPSAEKSSPLRKNYDFNNLEMQGQLRKL